MKKILLTAALVSLSVPALAADLPRRSAAPQPVYAAPIFTWSGFYVGAQAGYVWGTDKWAATGGLTATLKDNGILGGVHAGYNMQSGALVYGVEGDLEYGNAKDSATVSTYPLTSKIGTRGSLRLRAGYSFDRTLLYVTGGVAGASIKETAIVARTSYTNSGTRYGWTVGAGVEYAFTNNLSGRVEYRYSDFGKDSYTSGATTVTAKTTDHAVRVGISYRFGGSAGPVVARY